MQSCQNRGFSIIELVVVAGIIIILVSLLLAGIRAALDNGKKVQCQSQMRQLYLAITMYANDNGRIFPNIDNDNPAGAANGFMHYLGSYLDNPKPLIYQCSNASSAAATDSYYYYNDLFNTNKPASLEKLSGTLGDPISKIDIFSCRSGFKNGTPVSFFPHSKGVNVLFGDGRVVYVQKG